MSTPTVVSGDVPFPCIRYIAPGGLTTRIVLLALTLLSVAVPASAQNASAAKDVDSDVTKGDGDCGGALRKLDKLLFSSLSELPAGERYELLMLEGGCQSQPQDRLGAISGFNSAGKSAGDVTQPAAAQANVLIRERSSSARYVPRHEAGTEPIDILALDSQKQAMAARQAKLPSQHKLQANAPCAAQSFRRSSSSGRSSIPPVPPVAAARPAAWGSLGSRGTNSDPSCRSWTSTWSHNGIPIQ